MFGEASLIRRLLICGLTACLPAAASAQEQQPAVVDRVVVTGEVPVPRVGEGAPYHSVAEIEALSEAAQKDQVKATNNFRLAAASGVCRDPLLPSAMLPSRPVSMDDRHPPGPVLQVLYNDQKAAAARVTAAAGNAAAATAKADQSRRDAAAGSVMKTQVERLEIVRQREVEKLEKARLKLMEAQAAIADYGDLAFRGVKPITWGDLDGMAMRRKKAGWGLGLPKRVDKGKLEIAGLGANELIDDDGLYLRVGGFVINSSDQPLDVPDMVVSVLDERGLVLNNSAAIAMVRIKVPPKGAVRFLHDIHPSPGHVSHLVVNFASGLEPKGELPVGLLCPADNPIE
jgi:hypothetical protein